MKARITKIRVGAVLPEYHSKEAAAFDLSAAELVVALPGEVTKIPTGLVIQAPEGHFLLLAARSSLAQKKSLQLANGVGVVDRDYSGPNDEVFISVRNFGNEQVEIAAGERIAQGIFLKIDQIEWEETEKLEGESRGGFGSTGGYKESL